MTAPNPDAKPERVVLPPSTVAAVVVFVAGLLTAVWVADAALWLQILPTSLVASLAVLAVGATVETWLKRDAR